MKLKVNVTVVSHLHSRGLDRVNENFNPVHLILLPNLIDLAIAKLGNLAESVNCVVIFGSDIFRVIE